MSLKIILAGYPGSQVIVPASKYLTEKYLQIIEQNTREPFFDFIYLNYEGEINGWSNYLIDYLSKLDDPTIIFALDDYLISGDIDSMGFADALQMLGGDVVCVKLCESSEQEHKEYPITTQYCIWNREYLIWLLKSIKTPWQFEINGSRIFEQCVGKIVLHRPCIPYFTNSSLSAKWEGVNLTGLKNKDRDYLTENHLP